MKKKDVVDQPQLELPLPPSEPSGPKPAWHEEEKAPRGVNISDIGGHDVGESDGIVVMQF